MMKAEEDLTIRLETSDPSEWQLRNLKKGRYEHPLMLGPLKAFFGEERP